MNNDVIIHKNDSSMRRRSSLLHKVELKETRKSHIGQIIEKSAALRNNLSRIMTSLK